MNTKTRPTLSLDGKPFHTFQLPPIVQKVIKFLDQQSPTEIFTVSQLARLVGCSMRTLKDNGSLPELEKYSALARLGPTLKRLWGNPRAIEELRRQLESK